VATAADGRFVAVWKEKGRDAAHPGFVRARLFDAAGRPRSGAIGVGRVPPQAFGGRPAVAMAPGGRFVVVWDGDAEGHNRVFGRRFDAAGRPLGPPFRLGRTTGIEQYEPDVAMASDGSFVAVWYQPDGGVTEGPTTDVMFRRFDADGRPHGSEAVAIGGFEDQSVPRVALRPGGGFVVVCQVWMGEASFFDIEARLFSRTGVPLGDAFLVNDDSSTPEVNQLGPAVAVAANGSFAVAWTDLGGDLERDPGLPLEEYTGVAARFYAADGTPLGPSLQLNTFLPGVQEKPAVSALPNHGFLLLWTGGADQDGDAYGIFARVVGPDGQPRGEEEFVIPADPAGSQAFPAVSVAPNGRGIAAWAGSAGEGAAIFGRLLGLSQRR
jgi:hypothetical protein